MDCADEKRLAELTEPVRWESVRVWYCKPGSFTADGPIAGAITLVTTWSALTDRILGAIGVRSDGTTDWLSGSDWYGWIPFADDWRLSGIQGSQNEMLRVAVRYPGSVWKEGILVSDAEMARVTAEMSEYQRSLR